MKFPVNRKLLYKIIAGLILVMVTIAVYAVRQAGDPDIYLLEAADVEAAAGETPAELDYIPAQEEEITMVIDVSGEVANPSVYLLSEGARVYEAIEAAGGLTDQADTRNTNLAAPLSDGMKLCIPGKKDVEAEQKRTGELPGSRYINGNTDFNAGSGTDSQNALININTAGSAELQKLTGVGPSTAEKIIKYREEFGRFNKTEELMNVSGIGEKTFAKLKNAIIAE